MSLASLAAKQKAAKINEAGSVESPSKTVDLSMSRPKEMVTAGSTPAPAASLAKPKLNLTPPKLSLPAKKESDDTGTAIAPVESEQESQTSMVTASPKASQPLAGEIPATECMRDLPEDMTKEMESFLGLVDRVPTLFDDPEMLGQSLRRIMTDMQTNPEFEPMLSDEDTMNIIKAAKKVLGAVQFKAETKRTKTTSNRKTKPKLSADDMGDLDNLLADMGI